MKNLNIPIEVQERRKQVTSNFIRRIAKHTIEAHGLNCTIDEYIARCTVKD